MNHLRKSLIAAVAIVTTFAVYDVEAASRYIRENNKAGIIVFVHGVFGDAISTWTNPSTKVYWPTLLTQDSTFDSMDIYVYEYQ